MTNDSAATVASLDERREMRERYPRPELPYLDQTSRRIARRGIRKARRALERARQAASE